MVFEAYRTLFDKLFKKHPSDQKSLHIAILLKRNKVVSVGYNRNKTHPISVAFRKREYAINLHAETDCIKNFLKENKELDLENCVMIVARQNKSGQYINSEPCTGCKKAINNYRIKRTIYTNSFGGEFEYIGNRP